ncbi:MAG: DUF192 domain-containing protein [Candidatus Paceibacterota bacterium]
MAITILAAVLLAGAGIMILGFVLAQKEEYRKAEVIFKTEKGEAKFLAEVADNTFKRTRGLSGKENLGEKEGMLFVYSIAGKPGFWMKDMNFAIDIVWIKGEEVVGVTKEVKPESYKEGKVFYPPTKKVGETGPPVSEKVGETGLSEAVDKILEIKAGEAEKNNIKEGDKVEVVFGNF